MNAVTQSSVYPFYFGSPARHLYGVLHEAQTYAQREFGVVICYPFGNEYIRSHRACRYLATHLSQAGFPVLRFDYGGTGDSSGESENVSLAAWRTDIGRAIDALQDRTGVESVCLAGLRLGASLALQVATDRSGIEGLILWEPICNGKDYLAELAAQHRELLWRFFDNAGRLAAHSSHEYLGFPVSVALRREIDRLDLPDIPRSLDARTLIVEREPTPDVERLRDRLRSEDRNVAYQEIPSFATWREDVDKGLVPDPVLRGITTWAAEVLP